MTTARGRGSIVGAAILATSFLTTSAFFAAPANAALERRDMSACQRNNFCWWAEANFEGKMQKVKVTPGEGGSGGPGSPGSGGPGEGPGEGPGGPGSGMPGGPGEGPGEGPGGPGSGMPGGPGSSGPDGAAAVPGDMTMGALGDNAASFYNNSSRTVELTCDTESMEISSGEKVDNMECSGGRFAVLS